MHEVFARAVLLAGLLAACGEQAAHVQLVPIELPSNDPTNPCGNPAAGTVTAIEVIAYTPTGDVMRTDTVIDDFPADTEQIGIELLGGDGVAVAVGKTAPLSYGTLANGAQIPIAVLPPGGFCRTNDLNQPRAHPIVARAGDGVLILGGGSDDVATAEYYDPSTATFSPVDLPDALGSANDLIGASAATLANGHVAVTGERVLAVFDPTTLTFSSPSALNDDRIEHASLGLDATHVLVTGGCLPSDLMCDGTAMPEETTLVYELTADGVVTGHTMGEPALPATSVRYDGTLFDVGTISDGSRRLVLAGATSDPTSADQIPINPDGSGMSMTATGMYAQNVLLDGGALLTAFALDGSPQTGSAAILSPDSVTAAVPISLAPAWDGARLALAEDGSVIAIGGDAEVATYTPTTNMWTQSMPAGDTPGAIDGPSLVRLPDGSVLVLGGATPSTSAWLFRPSLVGPNSGSVYALPDGSTQGILTPTAPETVMYANTGAMPGSALTLTAPDDDLTASVLVGGPRTATGTVSASVSVKSGGVALIAQETAPAEALVARLVPGEAASIERHDGATTTTLCSGSTVTADVLSTGVTFVVTSTSATASFGIAQTTLLVSCDLSSDPVASTPGQWGIAATANGMIQVASINVTR